MAATSSSSSVAMSPIRLAGGGAAAVGGGGGRTRKITVNERVEQILQGSLQIEDDVDDARSLRGAHARESAAARSQQMSNLYGSSVEDRFVRTRVKAQSVRKLPQTLPSTSQQQQRTRRVPPITPITGNPLQHPHPQQSSLHAKNVITSPIKPVRCLSLQMLEQQRLEDELRAKPDDPIEPSPVQPKPWYKGYSTNFQLPTCSLDAKVRRYGAYGTAKMLAAATNAGTAPPLRMHASQSLDALATTNAPSPWSPALHGSPTLWPEDANYATGCALESHSMLRCPSPDYRFPTHSVPDVPTDSHFARTKATHTNDIRALERALDDEKALRKREAAHNQSQLEAWHARLHFEPLASKMDHPFVKVSARRAKELTILHTPAYSPESKYDEQVAKLTAKRFHLRWRNMAILLDVMRRTPCRRPVLQDIEKLYTLAYELASRNASPYELTRQQFWDLLQKEYPGVELRHANRLFSSYDVAMRDRLDIRVFLGTVRALRVQQGTPIEILNLSFHDLDPTKRGVVRDRAHLLTALTLCCGSEDEEQAMAELATALWTHMTSDVQQYHAHAHVRHPHSHNHEPSDRRESFSSSATPGNTEREAYESSSAGDSTFSLQYVRLALQTEKRTLALYSEMLLKRREECFKIPIPPSR